MNKELERIEICCENLETYTVIKEDVINVRLSKITQTVMFFANGHGEITNHADFTITLKNKDYKSNYYSISGIPLSFIDGNPITFFNRMRLLGDIVIVVLRFTDGKKLECYVPYEEDIEANLYPNRHQHCFLNNGDAEIIITITKNS